MTDEEWEQWATRIETRAKRLFAMALSLAGALALTVVGLLAAWNQVLEARTVVAEVEKKAEVAELRADRAETEAAGAAVKAEQVAEHVKAVDEVTQSNEKRLDATPGAPPGVAP